MESAILNPKFKTSVKKILIQTKNSNGHEDSIEITKYGDIFIVSKPYMSISTTADTKIITSLIEKSTDILTMYKLSEKESDFNSFFGSKTGVTEISFLNQNDSSLSTILFGTTDNLKNRITIKSKDSNVIYETEDKFSQYLTADINYWTEGDIISEINNPVELKFEEALTGSQASLTKIKIDEKSKDFIQKSKTLLSLRHGKLHTKTELEELQKIAFISMQDGNGRIVKLDFFKNTEGCLYTKTVIPSEIDSQESAFAFYSENAVYEISEWTYRRIKEIFFN
ncbi:hypothetical protein [Treponema sp.]|uniref:hypothetical protein n=1 Tax=Treponema sp. TaxID=166 RepID=UPI00388F6D99